jgi:uncharacterized protein
MALSLQEQLLKAGLADKKKATQISNQKRKSAKINKKHKIVEIDENKQAAEQAIEAKKAKDRELNARTKQEAEAKAVIAQIKQLIEVNKQPKDNGDIACNFTDDNKVKRLYVDVLTKKHISQGKLAIVKYAQGYEIVPMPVADKISERDENCVVYRADKVEQEAAAEKDDTQDWYAEYQIPDDLVW